MKPSCCNTHFRRKLRHTLNSHKTPSYAPLWRNSALNSGAQKRTRTSTTFRSPAPEAGASTNFAIWALGSIIGLAAKLADIHWNLDCMSVRDA
jgi:hypothetical protein